MLSERALFFFFSLGTALWASNTHGKGHRPFRLAMQGDNHLVIYDAHNHPTWASQTCNHGVDGAYLVMQDDGNCVVYDGARKVMSTANKIYIKKKQQTVF